MPDRPAIPADAVRQTLNVGLAAAQAVVPLLSSRDVGSATESEPRVPARPVPAAFAIWGPLFAGSLAYAGYQALPANRERPLLRRLGWLTAAAFGGNTLWQLVVPRRHLGTGQAIILGVAGSTAGAYLRAVDADRERRLRGGERWLVGLPVGALGGWTTAAAALSTADTLARAGALRRGRARQAGGLGLLAALAGGGAACTAHGGGAHRVPGAAYGAAVLWALAGIAANRRDAGPRTRAAAAAATLPVLAALATGGRRRRGGR